MVFTTRLAGGRGGRNALEHELRRLGITQKNGKPNHPQTQGKAERFQQTMKNWLRAQPRQPATLSDLQPLLDALASTRNTRRPHRSLPGRATPATAYAARPKAVPGDRSADTHDRVRTDHIDNTGLVTLRHQGRIYHIGTGRPHAGTRILLSTRTSDTRPPASHRAGQRKHREPYEGSRCPRCLATSQWWQVLGSNHRRLSRRFYSPLLLAEVDAADQRVRVDLQQDRDPVSGAAGHLGRGHPEFSHSDTAACSRS